MIENFMFQVFHGGLGAWENRSGARWRECAMDFDFDRAQWPWPTAHGAAAIVVLWSSGDVAMYDYKNSCVSLLLLTEVGSVSIDGIFFLPHKFAANGRLAAIL